MKLCGVDTVASGAVNGGLYDLDSVSRGDLVVRVGEMSLSGGGDAVVSGLDESVCCVNCVLQMVFSTCVVLTQLCLVLTSMCVVSVRL